MPVCKRCRLRSILQTSLAENAGDVVRHGADAEEEV
jgi:hypothetical protein